MCKCLISNLKRMEPHGCHAVLLRRGIQNPTRRTTTTKFSPFSLGRARKREKDQAGKENIAFQGSLLPPKDLAKPSKVDVISKIKTSFQCSSKLVKPNTINMNKLRGSPTKFATYPQYWTHLQHPSTLRWTLRDMNRQKRFPFLLHSSSGSRPIIMLSNHNMSFNGI